MAQPIKVNFIIIIHMGKDNYWMRMDKVCKQVCGSVANVHPFLLDYIIKINNFNILTKYSCSKIDLLPCKKFLLDRTYRLYLGISPFNISESYIFLKLVIVDSMVV